MSTLLRSNYLKPTIDQKYVKQINIRRFHKGYIIAEGDLRTIQIPESKKSVTYMTQIIKKGFWIFEKVEIYLLTIKNGEVIGKTCVYWES